MCPKIRIFMVSIQRGDDKEKLSFHMNNKVQHFQSIRYENLFLVNILMRATTSTILHILPQAHKNEQYGPMSNIVV